MLLAEDPDSAGVVDTITRLTIAPTPFGVSMLALIVVNHTGLCSFAHATTPDAKITKQF